MELQEFPNEMPRPRGLTDEIERMRTVVRALHELFSDSEMPEMLRLAEGVGRACTQLANLVKTQRVLDSTDTSFQAAMEEQLDQLREDVASGKTVLGEH